MGELEGVEAFERGELLLNAAGSLCEHRVLEMDDLVMAQHEHVILREGIVRRVRELAVLPVAVYGVLADILERVVHPAHVPLELKPQPTVIDARRHAGEDGRILGNKVRACLCRHDGVEPAQELRALKILRPAELIRPPLPASEARIQHRGDSVHAQRIDVELLHPVERAGYEKAPDLALAVVKRHRPPFGVFREQWVGGFIQRRPIKMLQPEAVLREMRRDPVEYDTDAVGVHRVHKIAEVVRRAVARGGAEIPRNLIAPRPVERVFAYADKLHMRVAHVVEVFRQLVGEAAVVEKAVGIEGVVLLP